MSVHETFQKAQFQPQVGDDLSVIIMCQSGKALN